MDIKIKKEKKNIYFAYLVDDKSICSEWNTPEETVTNLWYAYELMMEHRSTKNPISS